MADSNDLPDLVRAAQATAKVSQDKLAEIMTIANGQDLSDAQNTQVAAETVAIEMTAVDIFAVFEARMQGHFKRGPLSRKVKEALLAAGQADLADRLHQHYLAVNVLKHGTGASHRELLNNKSTLVVVKKTVDADTNVDGDPIGLIDVTTPEFFDGLADTILEAYQFLENR